MLKKGIMLIGDTKYNLYELKTKGFYRFDIVKNGAEFSNPDTSSVLFSCYKRKRRRRYGDMELYRKYIDAVTFLQKMQGETISESGWKQMIPYGNSFSHTVQKGERGHCLITRTRNGEWYEEQYEYDGMIIVMQIYNENFNLALIPVNDREYSYWK